MKYLASLSETDHVITAKESGGNDVHYNWSRAGNIIAGLKAEIRAAALRYVDEATPEEFERRWPRLCSAALIPITRAACAELRAFAEAGGLLLSDN